MPPLLLEAAVLQQAPLAGVEPALATAFLQWQRAHCTCGLLLRNEQPPPHGQTAHTARSTSGKHAPHLCTGRRASTRRPAAGSRANLWAPPEERLPGEQWLSGG